MSLSTSEVERLQAFAQAYAEAWCSQRPAQVAAFYAEGASLSVNQGEPAVGRAAISAVALGFMSAFPDMVVSLDELRFEDSVPHFHWTLVGINNGPGGTGRAVRISGYEKWLIGEDGLIAESNGSFDSLDYERQLHGNES